MTHTQDKRKYFSGLKLKRFPGLINLELTNYCNLCCDFCLNPKAGFRPRGFMLSGLFDKLYRELPRATRITLCGIGEPTLHPEFCSFVKKLGKKFSEVQLVTNGQAVSEEKIAAVFDGGISKITISLDYFEETVYKERKGGKLVAVVGFIDKILAEKKKHEKGPSIQINMLAQEGIFKQVVECLRYFADKLGDGDFVYSRHIKNLAGQSRIKPLEKEYGDLHKLRDSVAKYVDTGKYLVENWGRFLGVKVPFAQRLLCRHPYLYAMVLWDGRVVPCCIDFDCRMPVGDLNLSSIKEIWNGKKYSEFREDMAGLDFSRYPLCAVCPEWYKQK